MGNITLKGKYLNAVILSGFRDLKSCILTHSYVIYTLVDMTLNLDSSHIT